MEVGSIVPATVIKTFKTHLIAELENGYKGMAHISAISDYYVSSISTMFKIGQEYQFKISEIDNDKKRVKLDWKSIHPRFLKNPFKYVITETDGGFEKLLENTLKEVEND